MIDDEPVDLLCTSSEAPPGDALADALAEALSDSYADATPEELDDAVTEILESLSPAEAFGFTKALQQIGRGASSITSDPAFARVAASVLPVAGGAVGTLIGGPVGTALGTQVGSLAARALPQPRPAASPGSPPGAPIPSAVGGSPAAAQGLVLTQHPDVLRALLALAMGQHGRTQVNGVPVAAVMSMLSSVFGKAAEDADELAYLSDDAAESRDWDGDDESLYTALVDADNAELSQAVSWP